MTVPKFIRLISVIIITFICTGCSSETEDEPNIVFPDYHIEFYFNVVDNKGNNLIDPSNPNNILGQNISITYNGKKYPLKNYNDAIENFPSEPIDCTRFYGICNVPKSHENFPDKTPFIYVGKFFMPVWSTGKFTIHWGDNYTDDTLEFRKDPRTAINGEVSYLTTTWLNGEIRRNVTEFTIVKTPN